MPDSGELAELSALLNSSTQHYGDGSSYAAEVKDIFVGTGDSFLGMLRRGRIYQEQVPHMVRVLEEDLELYGATGIPLPEDVAPIAGYTPGFRKVVLTALVQAGVDSGNTEMAAATISGGAVPFIQSLGKRMSKSARRLVGANE